MARITIEDMKGRCFTVSPMGDEFYVVELQLQVMEVESGHKEEFYVYAESSTVADGKYYAIFAESKIGIWDRQEEEQQDIYDGEIEKYGSLAAASGSEYYEVFKIADGMLESLTRAYGEERDAF